MLRPLVFLTVLGAGCAATSAGGMPSLALDHATLTATRASGLTLAYLDYDADEVVVPIGMAYAMGFDAADAMLLADRLRETLADINHTHGDLTRGRLLLHVRVRSHRFFRKEPQTGALARVDWCASSTAGQVVFSETFYAGHRFVNTDPPVLKGRIHRAAVTRIATMAAALARGRPPTMASLATVGWVSTSTSVRALDAELARSSADRGAPMVIMRDRMTESPPYDWPRHVKTHRLVPPTRVEALDLSHTSTVYEPVTKTAVVIGPLRPFVQRAWQVYLGTAVGGTFVLGGQVQNLDRTERGLNSSADLLLTLGVRIYEMLSVQIASGGGFGGGLSSSFLGQITPEVGPLQSYGGVGSATPLLLEARFFPVRIGPWEPFVGHSVARWWDFNNSVLRSPSFRIDARLTGYGHGPSVGIQYRSPLMPQSRHWFASLYGRFDSIYWTPDIEVASLDKNVPFTPTPESRRVEAQWRGAFVESPMTQHLVLGLDIAVMF